MFKVKNDLPPNIVTDTFSQQSKTQYNVQYHGNFGTTSVYHGSESLSFLEPKIWNSLHLDLTLLESLNSSKMQIRIWKPESCP